MIKRQSALAAIAVTSLLLGGCQEDSEPRSYKTNQSEHLPRPAQSLYQQEVYVLLYKAGTTQEGIHSIDYADGRVVIIVFEDKKDAALFADKLITKNFPAPTVSAINGDDVEAFAIQAGYKLRFVRTGEQIDPPTRNLPTQHH